MENQIDVQVYELPHGWVYQVDQVYQEYNPDLPGFVPMTEAEAREKANIVANRLRGS